MAKLLTRNINVQSIVLDIMSCYWLIDTCKILGDNDAIKKTEKKLRKLEKQLK